MSVYPEHDKLMAISDISQEIGEFLDFGLEAQGILLAEFEPEGNRLRMTNRSIPEILAEYFGIDRKEIEREKRAMLDAIRNA